MPRVKQQACPKCNRAHLGPCQRAVGGSHRAPGRLRAHTPVLASPPAERPHRTGLPLLEAMGFAERELPMAPIVVAAPVAAPPRPLPLIPAHAGQRPLPSRPLPSRPRARTGMEGLVSALWDDHVLDPADAQLLPPNEFTFDDRRTRSFPVIAVVVVVAVLAATAGLMWNSTRSDMRAASDRATATAATAQEVAAELAEATAVVADPAAGSADLSGAAGVITRLSAVGLDLLGVGRETFPSRFGGADPVFDRPAFVAAGETAGELEHAMSALLTTRLVLEDLVELPALSTDPTDSARMGADLAAAVSRAQLRLVDVPADHSAIADDARATLERITERAGVYATDLRNGEPVGGHLSAFEADVEAFADRLGAYVGTRAGELEELRAAYQASVDGL